MLEFDGGKSNDFERRSSRGGGCRPAGNGGVISRTVQERGSRKARSHLYNLNVAARPSKKASP